MFVLVLEHAGREETFDAVGKWLSEGDPDASPGLRLIKELREEAGGVA